MGTDYFLKHPLLGILSNLPVIAGALALLALRWNAFSASLERRPGLWLGGAFAATRLLFLFVVVGAMGHVSLDLSTYFEAQGAAVLRGEIPYRDFKCSYGPLFPFLMALPAAVGGGVIPFFLFFVLADLGVVAALLSAGNEIGRERAIRAAWLHAAAPITWYFLVRYGQDEALAALFLATAWLCFRRGRESRAALILALGFAATKFTFGIFLPPFLLAAKRRIRFGVLLALCLVLPFVPFLLAGAPVWAPVTGEAGGLGFGPGIWRLPVVFTPLTLGWPASVLTIAALIAAWLLFRPGDRLAPARSLVVTGCVFLVLAPKVLPMYATPFWPLAALWLAGTARRRALAIAAAWNVLLGVWWYFDAGGLQGMFGPAVTALSVLVTGLIPVMTAWLGVECVKEPAEG